MNEEKQTPVALIVGIVAVVAVVAFVLGKGSGNEQQANEPTEPATPAEPQEPAFLEEGLAAYYPFNGNAKDESGNGNDLTSKGTTLTKDRHGNADGAYAFDGSTYMEAPNDASLQLTELTVSLWIKPITATQNTQLLFKDKHTGNNYGLTLGPGGSSLGFGFYPGNTADNGLGLAAQKAVPMNAYSMITATFGNKEGRFYLDGTLIGTKKFEKLPGAGNQPLFLGYDGGFQNDRYNKFKGTMDDIRIYNRALTEEQVKALYEWEKPKAE